MDVRTNKAYALVYGELHDNIKQALSYENEMWSAKGYKGMVHVIFEDTDGFEYDYFKDNEDYQDWTIKEWSNVITHDIMDHSEVLNAYINSEYLRVELINKIEY